MFVKLFIITVKVIFYFQLLLQLQLTSITVRARFLLFIIAYKLIDFVFFHAVERDQSVLIMLWSLNTHSYLFFLNNVINVL